VLCNVASFSRKKNGTYLTILAALFISNYSLHLSLGLEILRATFWLQVPLGIQSIMINEILDVSQSCVVKYQHCVYAFGESSLSVALSIFNVGLTL